MSEKIKVLMIDAFKLDYLRHASYLSSLTEKYQWGELQMPVGHWGGVEILFKGQSDKLALFRKSENSSLWWVKYFTWLDYFDKVGRFIIDCMINFIRLIKGQVLFKTGKIPLKRLYKFDFCVFDPLYKIPRIERKGFYELDNNGHKYGTKSKEIVNEIKKLDKKISQLDWDIIFSDHGMIDVSKTISVPITKDCFIDADLARYWGEKKELDEIKEKLNLKDGEIIDWPDKSFGELIFMVNTGILISPNFWQGREKAKAMHGYDGKHKEMKAFYLIKKKGKKQNLKVENLHKILMKMIAEKNGK